MGNRWWTLALAGLAVGAAVSLAAAQGQVEIRSTAPTPTPEFEIVEPGPTMRELTRPRDLEFYGEDQRVPYNPAFIEPLTTKTKGGTQVGLSGYTAPQTPAGPLSANNPQVSNGWFAIGITVIWDLIPPGAASTTAPSR